MDFSKQPTYAIDYVSGLIIAIGLTVIFYNAIRGQNELASSQFSGKIWLLALGSWASAFVVMFLGMVVIRWLPMAAAVASLILILFAVIRAAGWKGVSEVKPPERQPVGALVTVYFFVAALLLWGTIFARSYFSGSS